MQPVTIKNSQYINSLWLPQICSGVFIILLLWMGIEFNPWLLIAIPLVLLAFIKNDRTIQQQAHLQLSMRSNGQLVITDLGNTLALNVSHDDGPSAEIEAFWTVPHFLLLKLKMPGFEKPLFLTLFRPVVGAREFSHLLVGLTQLNATLKNNHENT